MVKLFVIGAGKMGGAIAGGMMSKGVFGSGEVAAFDISTAAAESFAKRVGCAAFSSYDEALEVLKGASAVLLAVKPQILAEALKPWRERGVDFSGKLVISIVAGVKMADLAKLIDSKRIVRVMPNTPALVGCGAAAYAPGEAAADADEKLVERILSSVGMVRRIKEADMDAVTALSGSGPAYVFAFIQALADGGVAEGLSRETALALAVQTVLGSAEMVARSGEHPAVLKDAVTSPGGTTIRALEVLADRGFSGAVVQAVRAAAKRSRELGGGR